MQTTMSSASLDGAVPRGRVSSAPVSNIQRANATVLERIDRINQGGSFFGSLLTANQQQRGNSRAAFSFNDDLLNFDVVEHILNSVESSFTDLPGGVVIDPGARLTHSINMALAQSLSPNAPPSLTRIGRANADLARRTRQPDDPSVPSTSPSLELAMVFTQMQTSIRELRGALPRFTNAISHMPDLGGVQTISDLTKIFNELELLMQTSSTSEASWKREWNVFFVSLRENNSNVMPMNDCCVCMEKRPVINVCNNSEQAHLLCSDCLLNHYWVNTAECTKSTASCPLCRCPIKITEIVERISNHQPITNTNQTEAPLLVAPSEASDIVRATAGARRINVKRPSLNRLAHHTTN